MELIKRSSGVERGYLPTDAIAVPIVDRPTGATVENEGLADCRLIAHAPNALTEQLQTPPGDLVPALSEIADILGMKPGELTAICGQA